MGIKRGMSWLFAVVLVCVIFVSTASAAVNASISDYNSTLAFINITDASNLYSYEIKLNASAANVFKIVFPQALRIVAGDSTYGNVSDGELITIYGTRLDATQTGVTFSNRVVANISYTGTLLLEEGIFINSNEIISTIDWQEFPPQITGLSEEYYMCEDDTFSKYFNISDPDEDPGVVSVSPSGFFVDPALYTGSGNTSVRVFSSAFNKSHVNTNYSITITASNGTVTDQENVNISVIEINHAPDLVDVASMSAVAGTELMYQFNATDTEDGNQSNGNLTYNITFLSGSAIFSINRTSGLISFTPASTDAGSYSVRVCVNDTGLNYVHPQIAQCSQTGGIMNECDDFTLTVSTSGTPSVDTGGGGGGGGGGGAAPAANATQPLANGTSPREINLSRFRVGDCVPEYQCGDWGACVNGNQERVCRDTHCGKDTKYVRPCSLTCNVSFVCGEWSECNYVGRTRDILAGEIKLNGYQYKECIDKSGCVGGYSEEGVCSEGKKLNFVVKEECGERFLAGMDGESPVSKIGISSLQSNQLDIVFVQGKESYCSSCYNGVRDGGETGVDCGGSCRACKEGGNYYWIILILSWVVVVALGVIMAVRTIPRSPYDSIRGLIRSGEYDLSRGNKDVAAEKYSGIKKIYSSLDDVSKAAIKKEILNFYGKISGNS